MNPPAPQVQPKASALPAVERRNPSPRGRPGGLAPQGLRRSGFQDALTSDAGGA